MAGTEVRYVLTGEDRTGPAFDKATRNMQRAQRDAEAASRGSANAFQMNMERMAASFATMRNMAVAGLTGGLVHKLFGTAMDYAEQERRFRNLGQSLNLTGRQMEEMRRSAKAMSVELVTPLESTMKGLGTFARITGNVRDAETAVRAVGRVAAVTGEDFDSVLETSANWVRQMGVNVGELQHAWGIITTASKQARVGAGEFRTSLETIAETGAKIGFKGEEGLAQLAAMLAAATERTGDLKGATSGLMTVLQGLATGGWAEAFGAKGWDAFRAFKAAQGSGRDMVQVLLDMATQLEKMDPIQFQRMFGNRDNILTISALRDNWMRVNRDAGDYRNQVDKIGIAHNQLQGDPLNSLKRIQLAWDQMRTSAGRLGETVGVPGFMEWFGQAMDHIAQSVESLDRALGKTVSGSGQSFRDWYGTVTGGVNPFRDIADSFERLNRELDKNPGSKGWTEWLKGELIRLLNLMTQLETETKKVWTQHQLKGLQFEEQEQAKKVEDFEARRAKLPGWLRSGTDTTYEAEKKKLEDIRKQIEELKPRAEADRQWLEERERSKTAPPGTVDKAFQDMGYPARTLENPAPNKPIAPSTGVQGQGALGPQPESVKSTFEKLGFPPSNYGLEQRSGLEKALDPLEKTSAQQLTEQKKTNELLQLASLHGGIGRFLPRGFGTGRGTDEGGVPMDYLRHGFAGAGGYEGSAFGPGGVFGRSGRGGTFGGPGTGPGSFGGSAKTVPGQQGSANRLMRDLIEKHGWTKEAAAIAAGNASVESKFRTGASGDPQVPGGSHGLFQWNRERFAALKSFAAAQGKPWTDWDTQVAFFNKEVRSNPRWASWPGQSSLEGAAPFGKSFEGYSTPTYGERNARGAGFLRNYDPSKVGELAQTGGGPGRDVTLPPSGTGGQVAEDQARLAGTRTMPLDPRVKATMESAAKAAGVDVQVYSGGQAAHGPHRVGSHRHDLGGAGDVKLRDPQTGRVLDARNAEDRARMAKFIEANVAGGNVGVGSAEGYMGPHSIHVGRGEAGAWGAGGRSANAPAWVREAWERGMARRRGEGGEPAPEARARGVDTSALIEAKQHAQELRDTLEKPIRMDVAGGPGDRGLATEFRRTNRYRGTGMDLREARYGSYADIGIA